MTITSTPQVCVQCLASYNAGRLIFEWVDATDVEEINAAQARVAAKAIAAAKEAKEYPVYFGDPEEFMIADYDNFPSAIVSELGEFPDYEKVAAFANLIEDKGFEFIEAAAQAIDDTGALDENWIDEHYRGEWEDEESFCRNLVEELDGFAGVPATITMRTHDFREVKIKPFDELDSYLDWEAIARAEFQHGNYTFIEGHVFEDEV